MSGDEVFAALTAAKECARRGELGRVVEAIDEAIKAWRVEVDAWVIELHDAERRARKDYARELIAFTDAFKALQ